MQNLVKILYYLKNLLSYFNKNGNNSFKNNFSIEDVKALVEKATEKAIKVRNRQETVAETLIGMLN